MTCDHSSGFGHAHGIDDGHTHCLDCGMREADAIESKWALLAADGMVKDLDELAKASPDRKTLKVLAVSLNNQISSYKNIRAGKTERVPSNGYGSLIQKCITHGTRRVEDIPR